MSGLKTTDTDLLNVAYGIGLGTDVDYGTAGQVLLTGGDESAECYWGDSSSHPHEESIIFNPVVARSVATNSVVSPATPSMTSTATPITNLSGQTFGISNYKLPTSANGIVVELTGSYYSVFDNNSVNGNVRIDSHSSNDTGYAGQYSACEMYNSTDLLSSSSDSFTIIHAISGLNGGQSYSFYPKFYFNTSTGASVGSHTLSIRFGGRGFAEFGQLVMTIKSISGMVYIL